MTTFGTCLRTKGLLAPGSHDIDSRFITQFLVQRSTSPSPYCLLSASIHFGLLIIPAPAASLSFSGAILGIYHVFSKVFSRRLLHGMLGGLHHFLFLHENRVSRSMILFVMLLFDEIPGLGKLLWVASQENRAGRWHSGASFLFTWPTSPSLFYDCIILHSGVVLA